MANFKYTSKQADGKMKRGVIAAASREEAAEQIGGQILSLVETKQRATSSAPGSGKRSHKMKVAKKTSSGSSQGVRFAVYGVAVVLLVGVGLMVATSFKKSTGTGSQTVVVASDLKQSAQVAAKPGQVPVVVHSDQTGVVASVASSEMRALRETRQVQQKAAVVTNKPFGSQPNRPPLFTSPVDSYLSRYTVPGQLALSLPLPKDFEEEARRTMMQKVPLLPTDTPQERARKEAVNIMKDEMRAYIAQGGSATQYVREIQARQKEESDLKRAAEREFMRMYREGNRDEAMKFFDEANRELGGKGISPLKVPPSFQKR